MRIDLLPMMTKKGQAQLWRAMALAIAQLFAQNSSLLAQQFDWGAIIKTDGDYDKGPLRVISVKPDGSVLCAAFFKGETDFDPTEDSLMVQAGNGKGYLWNLSESGELNWVSKPQGAYPFDLCVGSDGAAYWAHSGGHRLTKFNDTGAVEWIHGVTSVGQSWSYAEAITVDDSGYIYMAGMLDGTIEYLTPQGTETRTSGTRTSDLIVSKQNQDGEIIWMAQAESPGWLIANGISVDHDGNVICSGAFKGKTDFDPDTSSEYYVNSVSSLGDGFVLKLNRLGQLDWVQHLPSVGSNAVSVFSQGIAPDGGVICLGYFADSIDVAPGSDTHYIKSFYNNSNPVQFLEKLDADGNLEWAFNTGVRYVSSTVRQEGRVRVDEFGRAYLVSSFSDPNLDIDSGPDTLLVHSNGSYDIVLMKYDQNGQFMTGFGFGCGSSRYEQGTDVGIITGGGFYLAGMAGNNVDLDPSVDTALFNTWGESDIFVSRFFDCPYLDTNVSVEGSSLVSMAIADSFQWIHCDATHTVVAGETGSHFAPQDSLYYAVVMNRNGCSDTSACYAVSIEAIDEIEEQPMRVYPNPTSDWLVIEPTVQSLVSHIRLYNALGQSILEMQPEKMGPVRLDLRSVPCGMYYLNVQMDGREWVVKTVVTAPAP